jgi:hypothetical protein
VKDRGLFKKGLSHNEMIAFNNMEEKFKNIIIEEYQGNIIWK